MTKIFTQSDRGLTISSAGLSIDEFYMTCVQFAIDNGMRTETDMTPIFAKVYDGEKLSYEQDDELYWAYYNAIRYLTSISEPPFSFDFDEFGDLVFDDWS